MENLKTSIVRKRDNLKRDEVPHHAHPFRNPVHTADTSQFSERTLFSFLLLFRSLNALTIRTYFVPDEFWQGPEVAHRIVYGYGYLTWEWYEGIRGWTSPVIYAAAYQILAVLHLDSALSLTLVPRLVQACFAALGDLFLYKLAVKRFDSIVGRWTLICYLISWFAFFSVTRTLTNSLETVFTTIALFYWPVNSTDKCSNVEIIKSLSFAAVSCLMRPTAAVVWIPLCALHIFSSSNKLAFVVKCILPVGAIAMLWSLVVDSWFNGRVTFVQLNFLHFNVVNNRGTFYGSHPWHWYFSQGFPVIMFTHLIAFAGGIKGALPRQRTLAWLILWTVFIYSFLGHKEFRFISPVLPLAMCYCGLFLSQLSRPMVNGIVVTGSGWKAKLLVLFLAITNIPVAFYTVTIHQRGTIDVMNYLRTKSQQVQNSADMSVLFLMPCHSTPFYSFVHRNITMRFLECPPSDKEGYIDEADLFYMDPSAWLSTSLGNSPSTPKGQVILPSHIVFYSVLLPSISNILKDFVYTECANYFHTHFPAERRIGTHVLVYCWQHDKRFHRQDR